MRTFAHVVTMNYHEHYIDPKDLINTSYDIPEGAQGMGIVQDGDRAFIFGFKTKREVFAELGYIMVPQDDHNLDACAKALCDILKMQAVVKAMTLSPEALLEKLPEEEKNAAATERSIAVILTAAHQAVAHYANQKNQ